MTSSAKLNSPRSLISPPEGGPLTFCTGRLRPEVIPGDPGVDSGGEGKSKRAEKYGTKKSKERREEPLGTMSY